MIETDEKTTSFFLKEYQDLIKKHDVSNYKKGEIDQSFWKLNLTSLKNEKIKTKDFKGKFILLNFWGEWCKPCIAEIPYLIEIYNNY